MINFTIYSADCVGNSARLHRQGQKETVVIHHILCKIQSMKM